MNVILMTNTHWGEGFWSIWLGNDRGKAKVNPTNFKSL